jgi:hypothetical protein
MHAVLMAISAVILLVARFVFAHLLVPGREDIAPAQEAVSSA